MTEAAAVAAGYRPAGVLPPSGVYRVERPPLGEPRVVIQSRLQRRQPRRGFEQEMASAASYGIAEIARWERAHSQGAGFGAEAREAIRLAPQVVNQELQNRGVEQTIRDLVEILPPGTELHLTTVTMTHERTLRLREIQYKLEAVSGDLRRTLFVTSIEVSRSGRAVPQVEPIGQWLE